MHGPTGISRVISNARTPAAKIKRAHATTTRFCTVAYNRTQARCVVLALSVLNLGLSAMMGSLGILTLITYKPSSVKDLTLAFLACYMVIFAALLFCYEFIWWQPVAALNVTFRKNFGFFYGLNGKGFYLVFIAFLTLGLLNNAVSSSLKGLAYATGLGWLAAGVLHIAVSCTVEGANAVYKPPTVGLAQLGQQDAVNPV